MTKCKKCGEEYRDEGFHKEGLYSEDVESYNEALKREYGNLLKEPMKAERG